MLLVIQYTKTMLQTQNLYCVHQCFITLKCWLSVTIDLSADSSQAWIFLGIVTSSLLSYCLERKLSAYDRHVPQLLESRRLRKIFRRDRSQNLDRKESKDLISASKYEQNEENNLEIRESWT